MGRYVIEQMQEDINGRITMVTVWVFIVKKQAQGTLIFREKGRPGVNHPFLQLTYSHVVGVKTRESLLIGEIWSECDGHEGARGEHDFLAGGLLCVCGLPTTEGCQHLVFGFYLWDQRGREQDE